jgi:hypothetical protein
MTGSFDHELWLFFFAGILKQRIINSRGALPPAAPARAPHAGAQC